MNIQTFYSTAKNLKGANWIFFKNIWSKNALSFKNLNTTFAQFL